MSVSKKQLEEDFKVIVDSTEKNDKLCWTRKRKKIEKLIESLDPINEKILELYDQKRPIEDEILQLREEMVRECIHPLDNLVHNTDYILCKFCNTRIGINRKL